MKYFLDTANLQDIRYYCDVFPIAGVTSNPSIVKKEGKIDFFAHMKEIRSIIGIDRPLHIQVTAPDTEGMLGDADTLLTKIDPEVYVKVPVTMEGIKAGAHTATMDPAILKDVLTQPYITNAVDTFDSDWKSVFAEKTISEL